MASQNWYYVEADERVGPLDRAEIERLISTGTIKPNTAVWTDGMGDWVPAQTQFDVSLKGLTPRGATAAPSDLYEGAPARTFGEAISVCFTKYFDFSGRASRSEYWLWMLFAVAVGMFTFFVDTLAFGDNTEFSPLNSVFSLATFLPGLAVFTRRLHDTNRSGWWVGGFFFVSFIFGIGQAMVAETNTLQTYPDPIFWLLTLGFAIYAAIMLFFLCIKGDRGPNKYG